MISLFTSIIIQRSFKDHPGIMEQGNKLIIISIIAVFGMVLCGICIIYEEYQTCYDICTSEPELCLIERLNTTFPFWTIHSYSHPYDEDLITKWNGTRPVPGNHSCHHYRNGYAVPGNCRSKCNLHYALEAGAIVLGYEQ